MKTTLFFLALICLCSCATLPPRKPTGLTPGAFWAEQSHRTNQLPRLEGKLVLRLQSKAQNVSGQGRFVQQGPGLSRLELRDPLGRLQLVLAEDESSFVAYYPRQKEAFVDKQGGKAYVRKFVGVGLSFSELEKLLYGVLPSRFSGTFDKWEWDSTHAAYRGELSHGSVVAYVDPDNASLLELELHFDDEVFHAVFSDPESCCNEATPSASFPLARDVRAELSQSHNSIEVEWDRVHREESLRPNSIFRVSLPEDVKKIEL